MFVFTGNPEQSILFFYAKENKHDALCRLMKLTSSEHNGQSFLSSVLELDVLAPPQLWHVLYMFFNASKMNLHLIHDTYFTLNLSPFMCQSGKTLFEVFRLNFSLRQLSRNSRRSGSTDTHTHANTNTQT